MAELEKAALEVYPKNISYSTIIDQMFDYNAEKRNIWIDGAEWMKGWIMNNATLLNSRILPTNIEENEFCLDDFDEDEVDVITKAVNNKKFKCGDKVKIIIIKEE